MIWKRTIVLFWLSIAFSVLLAAQSYLDYRERHPCRFLHKSEVISTRRDVSFQEAPVGFAPCDADFEIGFWPKALVISWFVVWIAFLSSFTQDVFLYLRGRRNGAIIGSFRWRK